jgi:predicted metal-dependent hydrolase
LSAHHAFEEHKHEECEHAVVPVVIETPAKRRIMVLVLLMVMIMVFLLLFLMMMMMMMMMMMLMMMKKKKNEEYEVISTFLPTTKIGISLGRRRKVPSSESRTGRGRKARGCRIR